MKLCIEYTERYRPEIFELAGYNPGHAFEAPDDLYARFLAAQDAADELLGELEALATQQGWKAGGL